MEISIVYGMGLIFTGFVAGLIIQAQKGFRTWSNVQKLGLLLQVSIGVGLLLNYIDVYVWNIGLPTGEYVRKWTLQYVKRTWRAPLCWW